MIFKAYLFFQMAHIIKDALKTEIYVAKESINFVTTTTFIQEVGKKDYQVVLVSKFHR